MQSKIFEIEDLPIGKTVEQIVRGGRDKFSLLPEGFKGIKQIGVIGWGSQGPAQAPNQRDSLASIGSDIKVVVGLREGSSSMAKARAAGFSEDNGTLGEMYEVIGNSDLVILLISDAAQVEEWSKISAAIKPGAILGLSHGFLKGYFDSTGGAVNFADHYSVIAVCPKGMGPSVRRLYEQGKEVNGAGINCSIAVERDLNGQATDVAIAWAIAIGAPYIFETTLTNEYKSDIFGEQCDLLGGPHGMVESLFCFFAMRLGMSMEEAFIQSVENLTGPLSSLISKQGIIGVYNHLDVNGKAFFEEVYTLSYKAFLPLIHEIYDEVESGNEIRSRILASKRLKRFGWSEIGESEMWQIGKIVRSKRDREEAKSLESNPINPITAGMYCAMMMAQVDVLLEHGHCLSEICNESVIEAVDSLFPYMHVRGVAYMVDNCSTTARLGTRKQGPRFGYLVAQLVTPYLCGKVGIDKQLIKDFVGHEIHSALAVCATMRPTVDISVK